MFPMLDSVVKYVAFVEERPKIFIQNAVIRWFFSVSTIETITIFQPIIVYNMWWRMYLKVWWRMWVNITPFVDVPNPCLSFTGSLQACLKMEMQISIQLSTSGT
jgi:hypothetical protein